MAFVLFFRDLLAFWLKGSVSDCDCRQTVNWKLIHVFEVHYSSRFQTFAVFWMLCSLLWVFPRHLNFMCRCFGTLCSILLHFPPSYSSCLHHLWRWDWQSVPKRRNKIQTPGNHPKERILHYSSFLLSSTFFYVLVVGVEGYCYIWSHLRTHTHTHTNTHTRARIRTALVEGTACRREIYQSTHNIPQDSNPQYQQANGRRPTV